MRDRCADGDLRVGGGDLVKFGEAREQQEGGPAARPADARMLRVAPANGVVARSTAAATASCKERGVRTDRACDMISALACEGKARQPCRNGQVRFGVFGLSDGLGLQ